jgi:hypothetical protein
MSNKEHALKYELHTTIELQMHDENSGLRNQCMKMLKKLKKEINILERK